jgi:hypothetical protein
MRQMLDQTIPKEESEIDQSMIWTIRTVFGNGHSSEQTENPFSFIFFSNFHPTPGREERGTEAINPVTSAGT